MIHEQDTEKSKPENNIAKGNYYYVITILSGYNSPSTTSTVS